MAVARVEHGNAGREIDVLPALGIGQQGIVGLHGMEAAHHAHAARHGGVAPVLELLVRGRGGGAGHERGLRWWGCKASRYSGDWFHDWSQLFKRMRTEEGTVG